MALYHFTAKSISMGNGESAVHRAAYHARTQLDDERNGKATRDYAYKGDLAWSGIFAPKDAPDWTRDRLQLWNRAEKAERQANGQPARNIEFALPNELTRKQQIRLLTDFSREQFARKGMIADVCLHSDFDAHGVRRPGVRLDEPRNDHAHMMLTMRRLDGDMFKKTKTDAREWNSREQLAAWRDGWAKAGAKALQKAGFAVEAERFAVGHKTLPEQRAAAIERGDTAWAEQLDREPDMKQGAAVSQMEERGQKTDRGEKRRDIEDRNAERADLVAESKVIDLELERIRREPGEALPRPVSKDAASGAAGQGRRDHARAERTAADKVRSALDDRFQAQRARHDAAYQNRQADLARLREDHQGQRDAVYGKYVPALDAVWKPQPGPKGIGPDRSAWDRIRAVLTSRKAVFDARETHVWGQLVNAVILGRGKGVTQLVRLALDPAERRRLFDLQQRKIAATLAPRRPRQPAARPRAVAPEPRRVQADRLKAMRAAELSALDRTFRAAEGALKARHQFQRAGERDERTRFAADAKEAWGEHRQAFAASETTSAQSAPRTDSDFSAVERPERTPGGHGGDIGRETPQPAPSGQAEADPQRRQWTSEELARAVEAERKAREKRDRVWELDPGREL